MNNCVINTLPHHDSSIVIQTIWEEDSIKISLYLSYEKNGYRGTLLKSNITTAANVLELNVDEFMAETKKALCSPNGLPEFIYILDESKTFKFCKSTEAGFRITYGKVQLEDCPDVVEEILMNSIRINQLKDQQIEQSHLFIRRTEDTFNEMKMALDKCVEEKNNLENELLTKFAALLNTKKEKIAELERAIKNGSEFVDVDFESDGSGDSDPDYCSQIYARTREKSPAPTTSIQAANNDAVIVIPKRSKNKQIANETTVNVEDTRASNTSTSMDIYERETEMLLDDL